MPAYEPFLLPLLPWLATPSRPPATPLEEEACLLRADGKTLCWHSVAREAEKAYGMPFLESMETINPDSNQTAVPIAGGSGRYIVRGELFLINHPSGLHLFGQHGRPGQRPVLARPSVFSRWFAMAGQKAPQTPSGIQPGPGVDAVAETAFSGFLGRIVATGASDWHLEPKREGWCSRIRVHGKMEGNQDLSLRKGKWLVNSIIQRAGLGGSQPGVPLEGTIPFQIPGGDWIRIRISFLPSLQGPSMVARFPNTRMDARPGLDHLGMDPDQVARVEAVMARRDGLCLAVGPTGSGKSTTLRSLIYRAIDKNEKILAVEDPVEHLVPGVQQVEVNPPGITFEKSLRAFMRQAPDTLLVGEIRDPETAAIALQAALTGHRVLGTVHAGDDIGARHRFADLGQEESLLSDICGLVIHQRLVPELCRGCRRPVTPGPGRWPPGQPQAPLYRASGCSLCQGGYTGRTALFALGNLQAPVDIAAALSKQALNLLFTGRLDPESAAPYCPTAIRAYFSFTNRKDFANYPS